ncbi:MAG: hypothetical protein IPN92_04135 [Chromatiaceae bacterium]|nr:hypothetical protein [Chromatiaceae bacterium]
MKQILQNMQNLGEFFVVPGAGKTIMTAGGGERLDAPEGLSRALRESGPAPTPLP